MNYARYFAAITKNNGQPNLSTDQFRRMMNIVYLEGVIDGIRKIKKKSTEEPYKYDMLIFEQETVLKNLTCNLEPKQLLTEMHRLTDN